ncbi:tetratricopeptide repeat protein [Olsenella sp. An270]|uniref:tetratricopeptide repeat protein n=1 Tax=Olsenella sp. An270 TaxID=1965615 RepID=UPI000B37106E|nr:tetratricopeptide repeat protein [Olsenella sp. An270]OUO59853.1 hypothetical protein B5F73_04775 [Olsenella sp. An270]
MAKWRLAQNGEKDGAQARSSNAKTKKRERRPGELSTFQKVVIVLFIAVFALSTLAGALASVFQSSQTVEYNVDYVDSQYADYVADLESQLEEDPENAETLLATARACSSWGTSVMMLAATDDEASHGTELVQRAIGYYDRYLALDNASDARVERAMCEYYLGDAETAKADLEAVTTDDPEYAPAWYDLGLLYEGQGLTDEARAAYQKAVELDPDDEQGVGTNAQSRIDALTGAEDEASSDDEGATTQEDDSSETAE